VPFKKIKKGKGRGKYRSPSGRVFSKSQVRRYYARGGTFDAASCACRRPHGQFTCDAARTARRDPSQTLDLRRGFTRALETRWRRLSGLVVEALLRQDMFGIAQSSARSIAEISNHGGRVPAFQSWFDAALADTVLGMNRTQWIGQYVAGAYMRGWARTARTIGRTDIQPLRDRADLLVELTITDLQGAIEVVSQQCVRAFADGIMHVTPAREIVRLIRARIDHIGVVRSRSTADFMVVRASNEAALDVLQLAGHQMVGVLPETLPSPGRRKPVRDEGATVHSLFDAAKKRRRKVLNKALFEVLTAEDDDVCPICEDIADSGPYTLAEARGLIPAHPHCRCQFVPVGDRRFAPIVREAA
jgi:hypothetical protein